MWKRSAGAAIVLLSSGAHGQAPTELFQCGPGFCYEYLPCCAIVDCDLTVGWESWEGAHWWGPLRYIGPIQISVEARPWSAPTRQLPLYFLVRNDAGAGRCEYRTGNLIWETYGTLRCDSLWVDSPAIVLPNIAMGSEYWIQTLALTQFGPDPTSVDDAYSAFRRCIRVRPITTAVDSKTWGQIKVLYR